MLRRDSFLTFALLLATVVIPTLIWFFSYIRPLDALILVVGVFM